MKASKFTEVQIAFALKQAEEGASVAEACQRGVTLDFDRTEKPTDNVFIACLNTKFRAECLTTHWFMKLSDARTKMEDGRRGDNDVRPHSAIGNKPPISLMNGSEIEEPPQAAPAPGNLLPGDPTQGTRSV